MAKCFLLGYKGFVGSHLLPKLQDAGYDVVTDMRFFDDKYDVIINLAAVTHIRNEFDPKMIESNIILVDKVFKRSERIIYASSCSAKYFTNPYSGTKLWAEYLGNKHGNALGLRFFNVYGLNNNKGIVWFLMQQKDGAKITIRGPELIRDYIAVQDVVMFIIKQLPFYVIDVGVISKFNNDNTDESKDLKYFLKNHTEVPNASRQLDLFKPGVIDIGTGIGTRTIDLVSIYTKLSGNKFEIETIPPDASEPLSMVSNNVVPHMSLEEGLYRTINHGNNTDELQKYY